MKAVVSSENKVLDKKMVAGKKGHPHGWRFASKDLWIWFVLFWLVLFQPIMSFYFLWRFSYAGDAVLKASLLGIVFAVMLVFEVVTEMCSAKTCTEIFLKIKKKTSVPESFSFALLKGDFFTVFSLRF